uniref:F-box domain-containing protein n=2 Tax=Bursaphelenchus xylophilus TaxID=6326 RepID=A0A1I7SJF8_BURXY
LLLEIASYLPPCTLYRAVQVCRRWRRLLSDDNNRRGKNYRTDILLDMKNLNINFSSSNWKSIAIRNFKIESNWRKLNARFLDVRVEDLQVIWFRLHDDIACIFTAEKSLHVATISGNRIIAEFPDFHSISSTLEPHILFGNEGKSILFAIDGFVKVCGVDEDWNQCVALEICYPEDFVHCRPAISKLR